MITILCKYQFRYKPFKIIIKTTLYSIYRKHSEDSQIMSSLYYDFFKISRQWARGEGGIRSLLYGGMSN